MGNERLGTVYIEVKLDSTKSERQQQKLLNDIKKIGVEGEAGLTKSFSNLGVKTDRIYQLMANKAIASYQRITTSANTSASEQYRAQAAMVAKINTINQQMARNPLYETLGIKSVAAMNAQKQAIISSYNTIKASGTATAQDLVNIERAKNAKLKALNKEMVGQHAMSMAAMMRAVLRFYAAYYVVSNVIRVGVESVMSGIRAIDELKISTIAVAAQLTSMQGPENVTENFRKNVVYADALNKKLMEIDASSFANYQQIQLMNRAMVAQGVVLDVNNAKQIESFTAITNAVAMLTTGQNKSKQASQEARALFSGQVKETNQVALSLDALIKKQGIYKGGLEELVAEGKKHGDTLERFKPYLIGINAATADIQKTWEAVAASIETAWGIIQRAVFEDVYKDLTAGGRKAAAYMRKNADEIASHIKSVAKVFKDAFSGVSSVFKLMAAGAMVAYWAVLNLAGGITYLRSKFALLASHRKAYRDEFEDIKMQAQAAYAAVIALEKSAASPFLVTPTQQQEDTRGKALIPFIPPTAEYEEALDEIKNATLKTKLEISEIGLSQHEITLQQITHEEDSRLNALARERQGYEESLEGFLKTQISKREMDAETAEQYKNKHLDQFDKAQEDRRIAITEAANNQIILIYKKAFAKIAEDKKKLIKDWSEIQQSYALTDTDNQLRQLNIQYEKFVKVVEDKVALEKWLAAETLQIQATAANQSIALYQELYESTGLEQYAEKAIAEYSKVMDAAEVTWGKILDNEEDIAILRLKKEQEFADKLYGIFNDIVEAEQKTADERIKIVKELTQDKIEEEQKASDTTSNHFPDSPGRFYVYQGETWFDASALQDYIKEQKATNEELENIAAEIVKTNQLAEEQAQREIDRILEERRSAVTGQYDRLIDWLVTKQRTEWGLSEYGAEFDKVSAYAGELDSEEAGFYENGLNALEEMVDLLIMIDSLEQQQATEQKRLSDTLLSSIQSIDETILSLKMSELAPVTSKELFTTTYADMLAAAKTDSENIGALTSFIEQTYLPFMKSYYVGDEGYITEFDKVIADLDELRESYGSEWLGLTGGEKITYKWEDMVTLPDPADEGFATIYTKDFMYTLPDKDSEDFIETYLKGDLYVLPNKNTDLIEVYLKGDMFLLPNKTAFDFIEKYSKDELYALPNPTDEDFKKTYLWVDMINLPAPEKIDWDTLIDFDVQGLADMMNSAIAGIGTTGDGLPFDVDYAGPKERGQYTSIEFNNAAWDAWDYQSDKAISSATQSIKDHFNEITSIDFFGTESDYETFKESLSQFTEMSLATTKLQEFVDVLGLVPGTAQLIIDKMKEGSDFETAFKNTVKNMADLEDPLKSVGVAASDTDTSTADLTTELAATLKPFEAVSLNLDAMSTNVKNQVGIAVDFFNKLADGLGFTFSAAEGVSLTTAIAALTPAPSALTIVKQVETTPSYWQPNRYNYYKELILGHMVPAHGSIWWSTGEKEYYGAGGLTDGIGMAGELGREWVVPTYEPQRSSFLKDVGVDSDKIGMTIAKHIIPLMTKNDGGVTVNLIVDGEVVNSVVKKGLAGQDTDLIEMVRNA